MLIICENSNRADTIQQCYTMLANVLPMAHLLDWGLQESRPAVVARNMIDWATAGDFTAQTVWGQHVDNSGDEPSGGVAAGGYANPTAG